MTISTQTIWVGDDQAAPFKAARDALPAFERCGSQEVTFHRLHTGPHIGHFLLVMRYADWQAYGQAQATLAADAWYQGHIQYVSSIGRIGERSLLVGLDFGLPDPPEAAGAEAASPVDLLVRYQGGNTPALVQAVQRIHPFFLRHGVQRVRFHRFHYGPHLGEYLLELRYPNWETFGVAQAAWSKDDWYRKHGAEVMRMTRTADRTFAVGLPLD